MLFYFVYFTYVCFVYPSGFNSFFLNNMFHLYCFVFLDHFMKRKKIPHDGNISKKYHTVETFQNLIEKSSKEAKSTPVRTHIIQDHLISSIGTDT